MNKTIAFILCILIVLSLDMLWILVLSQNHYNKLAKKIQQTDLQVKIIGAIVSYIFLFVGFIVFVVPKCKNIKESLMYGFLYGITVYGIYNFTNYTMFTKYNLFDAFIDTAWGTFLFTITALLYFYLQS